jgi:prophage DNA circulation protein
VKTLYRQEAAAVLASILAALGNSVTTHSGRPASDLRRAIGDLLADAELLIEAGEIADPLAQAFDLAREAGATVDTLDRVRKTTEAIPTTSLVAASIKNAAIRFALVQFAEILAATTFTSRPEVDRYIDRMNDAFEAAELVASASLDVATYRAIIALHAAVTADLTARALPLPMVVSYTFPAGRPVLWLANRLYGDASRGDELIAENKPVHPAFMPPDVLALSR